MRYDEMVAFANQDPSFPCIVRLHDDDPCKAPLLEIHSAWSLDVTEALDNDAAERAGTDAVARFVETGRIHLGQPGVLDTRVRLMGSSGDWALYELNCMTADEIHAAVDRFDAAYGRETHRALARTA